MYNPFFWPLFCIGIYAAWAQLLIMGDPPEVTRNDLGRLGRR